MERPPASKKELRQWNEMEVMSFHADAVPQLSSKGQRATSYRGKTQRAELRNHLWEGRMLASCFPS